MTKIKIGEKLAFFVANVGNIPVMTLISSFLLIFYTDVVGLNPVAVGTLFLFTKLLDGINDPIVGFILDRMPRRKNGKFKPLLAIGAVMCSINFALVWFGPALAPVSLKMIVAYITYICIGITFDIMDISLNCMIPVMTSDMKERTSLSSIKGAGYMLGTVIVSVSAPLVINAFESKTDGYFVLISVTSIIVLAFSLIGAAAIKERVTPIRDENYSLKQLFSFLAVGPVFATFISQLLFIGGKSVTTASEVYFATYILGKFSIVALLSAVMLLGMIPAVLVNGFLVSKFGKKSFTAQVFLFSAWRVCCV